MHKIISVLSIISLVTGCTTHIPVRTDIIIKASREQVFDILTDFENYPEWNPYHIRVVAHGPVRVGTDLDVRVHRPDDQIIDVPHVKILRLVPDREITWGGGINYIFKGEHVMRLEDTKEGHTKLIHNEDFKGAFIGFADLPPLILTEGYERMNRALKNYAEAQIP